VVGAIGDVVTWISNLPGPILAVAGALGGWLLLRGPLTSLFSAIGSGISGMVAGMGTVSGAAGKIGPLLLRAFGGPVGLAITGVTLGLSLLAAAGPSVEDTIAQIDERMGALIGTLDQSTGAITQATEATLAKQLADDGMLARMEELGISTETFIQAATGQAGAMNELRGEVTGATKDILAHSEAYKAVEDALTKSGVTQSQFISAVQQGGEALSAVEAKVNAHAESVARQSGNTQDAYDIQNNFRAAVEGTTGPLQNAAGVMNLAGDTANRLAAEVDAAALVQRALGEAADASGMSVAELAGAAGDAAPSLDGLKAAVDEMGNAADYADQMTQFLIGTIDELNNGSINATASANAMESALRDIGSASRDVADAKQTEADKEAALKELRDSGTASAAELAAAERDLADASDGVSDAQDRQFETHIDVRDEALRQAAAAYEASAANGDLQGASNALNGVLTTQKQKFYDAQIAAGMEEGAARSLTEQLFAIPEDVLTRIKEQGAKEVQANALAAKGAVDGIPAIKTVTLSAVDGVSGVVAGDHDDQPDDQPGRSDRRRGRRRLHRCGRRPLGHQWPGHLTEAQGLGLGRHLGRGDHGRRVLPVDEVRHGAAQPQSGHGGGPRPRRHGGLPGWRDGAVLLRRSWRWVRQCWRQDRHRTDRRGDHRRDRPYRQGRVERCDRVRGRGTAKGG
jgi:hypothetical protein